MDKVDLIVAYVNCEDLNWQSLYHKYVSKENPRRFRDYGTLKYLLRGAEFNAPWLNRVFLVVQQESQLPKWLNRNNPKLRIVYHKEFIPREFLPTFNTNVIQNFYHLIPDLSDCFILANDDMLFLKPVKQEQYFIDGHPQTRFQIQTHKSVLASEGVFHHILYNDIVLFNKYCNTGELIEYRNWHIPLPYSKPLWTKVWKDCYNPLYHSILNSRTRQSKNLSEWLFNYIQMYLGVAQDNQNSEVYGYLLLSDSTDISKLEEVCDTARVACFNDNIINNTEIFKVLINKLEQVLPNKSSFEV